jgi:uncharacterized protein (DUF2141 family)
VAADDGTVPIRRAIVTISASALSADRSAIVDDEGRFAFGNLPAGRYTIKASKPAYVATAYGAKRPGGTGTPLALTAGQQVDGLTLRLARGAVIAGVVKSQSGEPFANVQVLAARTDRLASPGPVNPNAGELFSTDDRGAYRIFGLDPGEYVVAAIPRVTGIGDMLVMTSREIDAALARAQAARTNATRAGAQSGGAGQPTATRATAPAGTAYGFPPVFFPGTPSAADAQRIILAAGAERLGIDIVLEPAHAIAIDGTISMPDGGPVPATTVSLTSLGPALPQAFGSQVSATRPGTDGRFSYTGVVPGKYTLTARTAGIPTTVELQRTQTLSDRGLATPDAAARMAEQTAFYASVDIAPAEDLHGVTLVLQPMLTLKGRVVFDSASALPALDPRTLRVTLGPPPSAMVATTTESIAASVGITATAPNSIRPASPNADGTFDVFNILPGTYQVTVPITGAQAGQGWWLRSAMLGGQDVLDTLLEFKEARNLAGAVLTFSDRHTELTGRLATPSGQAASDCFMIAFSTDPAVWRPRARRVQVTRPATDGAFTFRDLPPGEYFLAALTDLDQDEWKDEPLLSQIAAAGAIKLTIGEGERKVQDLRIGG